MQQRVIARTESNRQANEGEGEGVGVVEEEEEGRGTLEGERNRIGVG